MILTLHDGTQVPIGVHGNIIGLRITSLTITLDDFKYLKDPEELAEWLMDAVYPCMVPPLTAKTSILAVEQCQRDVPAERPEGRIVGEEEIVESRGRKSTLGIPHKSGSKEYARAYYRRNKEKMIRRSLKWQQENKEKVTDYQKGYREQTKKDLSDLADSDSPKPRFEDVFGDDANTNTDKQEGDKDEP